MRSFSPHIQRLITEFEKLPSIGGKTAQRLAFHLLAQDKEVGLALSEAIKNAVTHASFCSECQNLSDKNPCPICSNPNRDHHMICVVERPQDVAAMERSKSYNGLYHVLHGAISPTNSISAEDIKLRELITRLQKNLDVEEIILATNTTTEGEGTALFIAKLLKSTGIKISRIAQGVSVGSSLEFADELSISSALKGRRTL